ncbi:MAG: 3-dehydroquinate synthase, partial [Clostridia bacterium]|nr:3-dehydroquinate synthase [Clostridia bacterium]
MTELEICAGSRAYTVYIGRNALSKIGELFSLDRKVLVLSDNMIPTEYVEKVTNSAKEARVIVLPHGEGAKSPENYLSIIKTMLELGFDRGDALIAVGGGVICDLGGFVAATYMRGIDFYTVPTSLLAQVDASVGGKVAVDFCGYKNVIGTFYQPSAVLIDTELLKTLPEREFSAGMAEVIKIFAIADRETFEKLENASDIKNPELIDEIVIRALKIKKQFVERDEKDHGVRAALNFGHTVGHAVESVCKDMIHGECVGVGMLALTE